MALHVIQNDKDLEPQNVEDCRKRNYWPKWKDVCRIIVINKTRSFGLVVQMLKGIKLIGCKLVFVQKRPNSL